MKHPWLSVVLFSVALGAPGPAATGEARQQPRSVLASVSGLEKPISISETKIALGELIQQIAESTGVPLRSSPDVADEPVAVIVKDFPARELLEQLAELLDYQWSRRSGVQAFGRSGDPVTTTPRPSTHSEPPERSDARTPERLNPVYEIWQDVASKQREEALRQGAVTAAEKRLRDQLRQCLEMAARSPEEVARIVAEGERHWAELRKLPVPQFAAQTAMPEERARRRRTNVARTLSEPLSRPLAMLLGRLSASQWSVLRQKGDLAFSTEPRRDELALPFAIARDLGAARPTQRYGVPIGPGARTEDPEARRRRQENELQESWAAATGYRVTITLNRRQLASDGSLGLNANVTPFRSGAAPLPPLPEQGVGYESNGDIVATPTGLFLFSGGASVTREAEDTPEREVTLAADSVAGAKHAFPPAHPTHPRKPFTTWFIRDWGEDLARVYDVQVISDAYWPASVLFSAMTGRSSAESPALYQVLDRQAGFSHRWDRRGKLIRLRSRTWFLDRPREVPLRLVRRWKELHDREGALSLDDYRQAATLNDGQVETLNTIVNLQALPRDFYSLDGGQHALRLYAALTPAEKQALFQGDPLPYARMSPPQRALFAAGLRDRAGVSDGMALLNAYFSVNRERYQRTREQRGQEVSYRDQPVGTVAVSGTALPATVFPVTRLHFFFRTGTGPAADAPLTVLPLP